MNVLLAPPRLSIPMKGSINDTEACLTHLKAYCGINKMMPMQVLRGSGPLFS